MARYIICIGCNVLAGEHGNKTMIMRSRYEVFICLGRVVRSFILGGASAINFFIRNFLRLIFRRSNNKLYTWFCRE